VSGGACLSRDQPSAEIAGPNHRIVSWKRPRRGSLDITDWLQWFLACLGKAIDGAEDILGSILGKAAFWDAHATLRWNERQRRVVERLLGDFEGKLTTSKWAILAKCSQDTALRDIDALVQAGILVRDQAGGRSTSYSFSDWPPVVS